MDKDKVLAALTAIGLEAESLECFDDVDLTKLSNAKYHSRSLLLSASRQSLAALLPPALVDCIMKAQGAVDRALKRQREGSVSVSSFNTERWCRLSGAAALQLENIVLQVVSDAKASSVPAFEWDARPEPAHADRFRYYLRKIVKLSELPDPLVWVPSDMMGKEMLSVAGMEDTLYYSHIKGNTDVAIARGVSVEAYTPSCGLCLLFEITKPQTSNQSLVFQAACKLVLANIHSSNLQPVVVLTDLVDRWTLLWINGNKVMVASCCGRDQAVSLVQGCVLQAEQRIEVERIKAAARDDVADVEDLEGAIPPEDMLHARSMEALAAVRRIPAFSCMEWGIGGMGRLWSREPRDERTAP
ncbi:hypothetical protein TSOC_002070 [Tetrabaena socialis]|uniref:Uncharacterized protein n=1 Tax=Tetrabaena socialis TaxID=47790 RepID=A0A2J8AF55_9CHLO|nr:hypothetical protein TSOC_002070 [Tetrabaena socialis]|eukprot:PNH11126.1 hypothetical protein TSOC_002070 [Tetrabaena socialis]